MSLFQDDYLETKTCLAMTEELNLQELTQKINDVIALHAKELVSDKLVLVGTVSQNEPLQKFFGEVIGCSVHCVEITQNSGQGIASHMANLDSFLRSPSKNIHEQVNTFDFEKSAVVYAGSFCRADHFCGRKVIGNRKPEWFEAERKSQQMHLLGELGHPSNKYFYVSRSSDVNESISAIIKQFPVVVSGDPILSLATGCSHCFLLLPVSHGREEIKEQTIQLLLKTCSGIKLSVFIPGKPATYYGYCIQGHTVIFGPVEALNFYNPQTCQISATGILYPITVPDTLLKSGQIVVEKLTKRLTSITGYQGAFGVDGVFTETRYIPHEINPRICAGFSWLKAVLNADFPLNVIDLIIRESSPETAQSIIELMKPTSKHLPDTMDIKLWSDDRGTEAQLLSLQQRTENPQLWRKTVLKTLGEDHGLLTVANLAIPQSLSGSDYEFGIPEQLL